MSDYTDIRTAVKYYLQSNFPSAASAVSGSGSPTDVDTAMDILILLACNNAQKWAQLKHDFRLNDVVVRATLPSTGLGKVITSLVDDFDGTTTYDLKSISHVWRVATDGTKYPVRWMTRAKWVTEKMDILNKIGRTSLDEERYPYDGLNQDQCWDSTVYVLVGNRLVCEPPNTEEISLVIDGQAWMTSYAMTTHETDWLADKGKAFLMFAAICEANLLIQTFVPRQEGSLPPPTAERDTHFTALMDWDNWADLGKDLITE